MRLILLVLAVLFAALMWDARQHLLEPWVLERQELVAIAPGQNIKSVIHAIEDNKFISEGRTSFYAAIYERRNHSDASLRAGEDQVTQGITKSTCVKMIP